MVDLSARSAAAPLAVVIVTYGNRWRFLEEVLNSLDDEPAVHSIVVVDNGCGWGVEHRVREVIHKASIIVVRHEHNVGSAAGFGSGLQIAARLSGVSHILLLDDDNRPRHGAIVALVDALEARTSPKSVRLMLRESREEIRLLHERAQPITHTRNSYCGVSLRRQLSLRRLHRRALLEAASAQRRIEYAPYGGLVLPIGALEDVGIPTADYYLYSDDHEYTTRLVRAGYEISLVADAGLEDLEASWHQRSRTLVTSADVRVTGDRAYYYTRNRRHFELSYLQQGRFEVAVNRAAYWSAVALDALLLLARGERPIAIWQRTQLLASAVRAARKGQLGPVDRAR